MSTGRANPSAVDAVRGAIRLTVDATRGVTRVVEAMHTTIAGGPAILGRPLALPARLATWPVYASIHGVTWLVGAALDRGLATAAAAVALQDPGEGTVRREHEAARAALNGVVGDHLAHSGNPLAIRMRLRRGGRALPVEQEALAAAIPEATRRLLVLVHGSSMCDLGWERAGHDHGAALARDLGWTPVYVHYNSGRHISENGRELAAELEALVARWPVPLDRLALVGHSMGGLVARSACHVGEAAGHRWRNALATLVTLGTPHHGAPLERGGNLLEELGALSRYSAPIARLGRLRSAGITDLRFGYVLDEHWAGRDRFALGRDPRTPLPLPSSVACYAIAASLGPPSASPRSDGLVPVASALGRHARQELTLEFPDGHTWVGFGMSHFDLLSQPAVYERLRGWLA